MKINIFDFDKFLDLMIDIKVSKQEQTNNTELTTDVKRVYKELKFSDVLFEKAIKQS